MSTLALNPSTRQRDNALCEANRVKALRVGLKRDVKELPTMEGRAVLGAVLEENPEWLNGQDLLRMLMWAPRVGERLASQIIRAAGASPYKRVGELTTRQRRVLAVELRSSRR